MPSLYLTLTLNTYHQMCQEIKKDSNSPKTIICHRWLASFHNFVEDMGYQPDGMILERINKNGNYEPSNCRWVLNESTPGKSIKQPQHLYNYRGINLSVEKWAAISGWNVRSLRKRINNNMTILEAITTPIKSNRSKFIAPTEDQLKLMILDYYDKYGLEFD